MTQDPRHRRPLSPRRERAGLARHGVVVASYAVRPCRHCGGTGAAVPAAAGPATVQRRRRPKPGDGEYRHGDPGE